MFVLQLESSTTHSLKRGLSGRSAFFLSPLPVMFTSHTWRCYKQNGLCGGISIMTMFIKCSSCRKIWWLTWTLLWLLLHHQLDFWSNVSTPTLCCQVQKKGHCQFKASAKTRVVSLICVIFWSCFLSNLSKRLDFQNLWRNFHFYVFGRIFSSSDMENNNGHVVFLQPL